MSPEPVRSDNAKLHEIVDATVRDGAEEEILSRRPALEAALRELPELLGIHLVRLDDGTYLGVLPWASRAAADAATESYPAIPAAGEICALVEEAHDRGEVAAA